jgi:L-serine/L-threonine ammonia-lyase
MGLSINTPCIESRYLSAAAERQIFVKLEALQPAGSFKIRGIGLLCEEHAARGARRFISSSGGNAGLAVAYAGRMLKVPVVVVVPESTPPRAKEMIRKEQAEVITHGASWQEAHELALSIATDQDAFVHPFDHPRMWSGHATVIDEVVQAGIQPQAVITAVGGGGLLCGIVEGLQRNNLSHVPVIAVETEGAHSLHQSIQAGERIELAAITSIATSLGAKKVAEQAFAYTKEHDIRSVVVSDAQAVRACLRFMDDHRIVVEPACGAALAVAYERLPVLDSFRSVLVIGCGGVTTTPRQLEDYALKLGAQ